MVKVNVGEVAVDMVAAVAEVDMVAVVAEVEAVKVVAEATGAPLTEIGPQVRDFVSDLVTQGFLSRQGQCRSGEQP